MKKFMKYEIKSSYKFILGILVILLIASTIIQLSISKEVKQGLILFGVNTGKEVGIFGILMVVVSVLTVFGGFITAFFYIIGLFKKELYEERGYLTFTLPLTGNQILGAKLIVAIIWFASLGLGLFLYNLLFAIILYGSSWLEFAKQVFTLVDAGAFSFIILSVISSISTLILIYFAMALSRVTIKNKKIGGLWFVIFIVLNIGINIFVLKTAKMIPYFLSLRTFKIFHYQELGNLIDITNSGANTILFGQDFEAYLNIFGNLTQIGIAILAFFTTGYLIEKKIDL